MQSGTHHDMVIYLSPDTPQTLHWLRLSAGQGILERGHIDDPDAWSSLRSRSEGHSVYLLVPAGAIGFHQVVLPGKHNASALQALPYLLEECVATDVEQLHVAILSRQGETLNLAVVEQTQMARWLDPFTECGIKIQALIPDVLALPLGNDADNEAMTSALRWGDQWLIRTGMDTGAVAACSWLSEFCDAWHNEHQTPLRVHSYSAVPDGLPDWHPQPAQDPLLLLAQGAISSRSSLLQGRYAPQKNYRSLVQLWRLPVIALVALLLLTLAPSLVQYWQLEQQVSQLQQQAEQGYRQLFPGRHIGNNLRGQLRQDMQTLQHSLPSQTWLDWLAPLPGLLSPFKTVEISGIQFDRQQGELRLQLRGDSFQTIEQLRKSAATHFTVVPVASSEQGGRIETTLILKEPH